MIGIYKIVNKINKKIYIGQSINIKIRLSVHKTAPFNKANKAYDSPLYRAIRKYGIKNFSFEILIECPQEKLNELENYYIQLYNTLAPHGYNQVLAEQGGTKLIPSQVKQIIHTLKTTTLSDLEIARQYDVCEKTIWAINYGVSWHNPTIKYPIIDRRKYSNPKHCLDCGQAIKTKADFCPACAYKKRRVINRPTREELKYLIRTTPFLHIAKQYKVSDTAIRKWCKFYNLPSRVFDIKQYSEAEWEKV